MIPPAIMPAVNSWPTMTPWAAAWLPTIEPSRMSRIDGRGLARAVRPEQGEHLAPADVEVDAGHRRDVPVALAQIPDHDRRAVVHDPSLGAPGRWRISRVAIPPVRRSVDSYSIRTAQAGRGAGAGAGAGRVRGRSGGCR